MSFYPVGGVDPRYVASSNAMSEGECAVQRVVQPMFWVMLPYSIPVQRSFFPYPLEQTVYFSPYLVEYRRPMTALLPEISPEAAFAYEKKEQLYVREEEKWVKKITGDVHTCKLSASSVIPMAQFLNFLAQKPDGLGLLTHLHFIAREKLGIGFVGKEFGSTFGYLLPTIEGEISATAMSDETARIITLLTKDQVGSKRLHYCRFLTHPELQRRVIS